MGLCPLMVFRLTAICLLGVVGVVWIEQVSVNQKKNLFHVHSHYTERERTLTSVKEPGAADERLVPFQGKNLRNLLRIFQVP